MTIPKEVKEALTEIYQASIKKYLPTLIFIIALLVIAAMFQLILGNNTTVEKDVEKAIEAKVATIENANSF